MDYAIRACYVTHFHRLNVALPAVNVRPVLSVSNYYSKCCNCLPNGLDFAKHVDLCGLDVLAVYTKTFCRLPKMFVGRE